MASNGNNIALTSVTSTSNPTAANNDKNSATNGNDNTDRLIPAYDITNGGGDNSISDLDMYRNKKTLTQGLMDIALFSSNANQLRYVFEHGSTSQAYFYIAATLIIFSLILQIGVGCLLLLSTRYKISTECDREKAYRCGNYVMIGIFLITVVNIFIAAFGGPAVVFPSTTPATS